MRRRELLAFGVRLARGRFATPLAVAAGFAIAFTATIAMAVVADDDHAPLGALTQWTSSALAWGAGVLIAIAGSKGAERRDRDNGFRSLAAYRGVSTREYVAARVLGVMTIVGTVVVGGTLFAGATAIALASRAALAETAQSVLASIVYSCAFTVLIAPMAMAMLAGNRRPFSFILLIALPELFARASGRAVNSEWRALLSIPGALRGLREAIGASPFESIQAGRSLLLLAIMFTLAVGALGLRDLRGARAERGDAQ